MNNTQFPLPGSVELFGVTIVVNELTLLLASIPLILLITLFVYRSTRPKRSQATLAIPEWNNGFAEPNYYFDIAPAKFSDSQIEDVSFVSPDSGSVPPIDELTMPVKVPSFTLDAVAFLKYVRGGENLPERLAIKKGEPALFGRNKSVCDHAIDDVRVSRLHAKITQAAGKFYIQDEGSSGGTFVNQQRLSIAEQYLLTDGDLINFNEVAYQFTLRG